MAWLLQRLHYSLWTPFDPDLDNILIDGRPQGRGALPFTGSPGGSNIPRPVGEHTSELGGVSAVSASRQKQTKRDEAIRRKMENDLSKKKNLATRARHSRKAPWYRSCLEA
ncbi:unnamed protein product [Parascedosporium putredinis]|uniref:Uncharacterized protein n=1 Tax=Parascedosporium putredinis TaxID=1442378 RepID=A0A9P1MBH4_9PEZI|nr:unnamed protein product [Parascedosporium putredinis]CAI7994814.1 unnamed protein product [Parascedosporium putredinis]